MPDEAGEVADRRWVKGHPAAHDREELRLVRVAENRYEVRQVGPCGATTGWPNYSLALAAVARVLTPEWTEVTANRSPAIRYGVRP
jgi:hypothetical protein